MTASEGKKRHSHMFTHDLQLWNGHHHTEISYCQISPQFFFQLSKLTNSTEFRFSYWVINGMCMYEFGLPCYLNIESGRCRQNLKIEYTFIKNQDWRRIISLLGSNQKCSWTTSIIYFNRFGLSSNIDLVPLQHLLPGKWEVFQRNVHLIMLHCGPQMEVCFP